MSLDPTGSGLPHFLAQSDTLGRALFALLVVMSLASWSIIAIKVLTLRQRERRSREFLGLFWNAAALDAVGRHLSGRAVADPFSELVQQALQAEAHHARHGASRLSEAGTRTEFVTRTIKRVLDSETTRLENGLTVLATVGATAPFVGLFGTVWGVYHALVAIGAGGAASIDRVAGPVGEALIMTGLGLAVAIPAVVGYNALVRAHRVLTARLDAFAHDVQTFVATGQPIRSAPSDPSAPADPDLARAEPAAVAA